MLASSFKAIFMDGVLLITQMDKLSIKAILLMEKNMGKVNSTMPMIITIMGIGLMISNMAQVFIIVRMDFIMGTGRTISNMVKAYLN